MAATLGAAAALGGTQLLGKLMELEAAKKRQQREAQVAAAQAAGQGQIDALGQSAQGQRDALARLMSAFQSGLG